MAEKTKQLNASQRQALVIFACAVEELLKHVAARDERAAELLARIAEARQELETLF